MEPQNPIQAPSGAHDKPRIIKVRCNGSFVYKEEIRDVLNLGRRSHWMSEIRLLKESVEGFWDDYEPYLHRTQVTTEIARIIIETVLERAGENVRLVFCWQDST